MFLKIEKINKKKLVGKSMEMTLSNNKTSELWQSFIIKRDLVKNRIDSNYISMQVYDYSKSSKTFNPNVGFEKWAVVEVSDFEEISEEMKSYELQGGLYAVFLHKGQPSTFYKTFKYIFEEWFPNSDYELDEREHFELLGEKYKNNDPTSEEEIFIPIRKRK